MVERPAEVSKVSNRLKAREIILELTQEATDFLIEKGYDPAYGARPLRRAIERYLEDPIAEEIIRGSFKAKDTVKVIRKGDELGFTTESPSEPPVSKSAPSAS